MLAMSRRMFAYIIAAILTAPITLGQGIPADLKVKLDSKIKQMQGLSNDPRVVTAVKAYNTAPPAEASQMTNEKWTALAADNALVVSLAKNDVAAALRSQADDSV